MTSIDMHEILTLFNWINSRLIQERIIYPPKKIPIKKRFGGSGREGGSLDPWHNQIKGLYFPHFIKKLTRPGERL